MKKGILLGLFAILATTLPVKAQNPRGQASLQLRDSQVSIDYGRPSLRERDPMRILPVGMVWRLGMDQSTSLKSTTPLDWHGTVVPAGTYSLYLRRAGEKEFELLVNRQTGQWGTSYTPQENTAAIPLTYSEIDTPVEIFTIELSGTPEGGQVEVTWGRVRLKATFAPG